MKRNLNLLVVILFVSCCLCFPLNISAQEQEPTEAEKTEQRIQALEDAVGKLKNLKISGYIQAQFQWGQENAQLKVGGPNTNPDKSFNRIGIRRGRIKIAYEKGIASGVFQIDLTERGIGLKDAYLSIKDPWVKSNSIKLGVFDRPFGFEISYSSSRRESPERATVFQTLFPEERDLGGMLTLQFPKTSPWSILKLEGGIFAGNGIKLETDNRRDFIGHLSASKSFNNISFGLGASYYNGSVYQSNENVYKMQDKGFVLNNDPTNVGRYAKREYIGFDGQFSILSILGMTQLRAEYLFGTQPGGPTNSKSPNSSTIVVADTYIRNFNGGYVIFVQDFGKLPLSAIFKYDWYDPNTKIAKNDIGLNGTGSADVIRQTFGFGILLRATENIRLTAYYELNRNETSQNLTNYTSDRSDDVFTFRVQYKF